MNDIEILEEIISKFNLIEEQNNYNHKVVLAVDYKELKAIENLLKERQSDKERIKDLEEINEAHKKENGELREELESVKEIYYTQKEMEDVMVRYRKLVENSIPKSLIKEKIEELKQEDLKIYDTDSEDVRIAKYEQRAILQVLEELLKGE